MKILVINGPNLNMLGIREPEIYGAQTYETLCDDIAKHAIELGVSVECYQSNHEGDLVTKIQDAYFSHVDGIVLNPAAYTHTSEEFRQVSYVRPACITAIWGHGFKGYLEAMDLLVNLEHAERKGEDEPCA